MSIFLKTTSVKVSYLGRKASLQLILIQEMSAAMLVFPEKVFFFYLLHLFVQNVVAVQKGATV